MNKNYNNTISACTEIVINGDIEFIANGSEELILEIKTTTVARLYMLTILFIPNSSNSPTRTYLPPNHNLKQTPYRTKKNTRL